MIPVEFSSEMSIMKIFCVLEKNFVLEGPGTAIFGLWAHDGRSRGGILLECSNPLFTFFVYQKWIYAG